MIPLDILFGVPCSERILSQKLLMLAIAGGMSGDTALQAEKPGLPGMEGCNTLGGRLSTKLATRCDISLQAHTRMKHV